MLFILTCVFLYFFLLHIVKNELGLCYRLLYKVDETLKHILCLLKCKNVLK